MSDFAISEVMPGQLNALVKKVMAQMGIKDPSEAVRRINAGEWIVKMAQLLRELSIIAISGYESFVAVDHLTKENGFWYLNDEFKTNFLPKVEGPSTPVKLAVHNLERDSLDEPIRKELGDGQTITLGQFFQALHKVKKEGWYLAYIEDIHGNTWAVGVGWSSGLGWGVDALSVDDPNGWARGYQVVSRKVA